MTSKAMKYSLEEWASRLFVPLYQEEYTQTLWNTEDIKKQEEGWWLKSGKWSPWFFNMRPVGSSPELFYQLCSAMAALTADHDDIDMFIAVEMAGINLSGGMAVASFLEQLFGRPIGYTRPLPKKARTPMEALTLLDAIDAGAVDQQQQNLVKAIEVLEKIDLSQLPEDQQQQSKALELLRAIDFEKVDYGQKEFVEARLIDGSKIGIFDDMAMDIGSKKIARLTVLWEAKRRNVTVECNKIFYILNRNPGNRQAGLDFANEPEQGLYPAPLEVNYIIEFNNHLPDLKTEMKEPEYEVISEFQKNTEHFQDEGVQKDVLRLAAKTR